MDIDWSDYPGAVPGALGQIVARPDDVASVDAIIAALYGSISFEPGHEPDWARFRSLFLKEARLIPRRAGSEPEIEVLSVRSFVTKSDQLLHDGTFYRRGFREEEVARRMENFGGIVQVFSTYQSYFADTNEAFYRGINSLQLIFHKARWWVASVVWENERSKSPIPDKYL